MRRWYLEWRTTLGFSLALVAVAAAGIAAYVQLQEARAAGDRVRHTWAVLAQLREVEIDLLDAETGQRGYILTGEDAYLTPYTRGRAAIDGALRELRRLTVTEPALQARLDVIEEMVAAKLGEQQQSIDARRSQGVEAALAVVATHVGKGVMDRIRSLVETLRSDERLALEEGIDQRGARFWWASRIALLANGLALVVVMLSTISVNRNIQRRARLERSLREGEERLRVTLDSIGDGVIATDPGGHVVFVNPVAQRLTGWTDRAARGRMLDEVFRIVNEHSRAAVPSPVAKVLSEGVVVGLGNQTILLSQDGRETPIDDSGAPIRDTEGEVMGVVLVFRDVSDRKRQELERLRLEQEETARRDAERASAMKDEFLANLSHELRSPLQGILGWLTVLRELRTDPAQRDRALQAIERGVHQQAQLVNDVLDISRIVAGKLQLEREPVELAAVVDDCIDQALPQAREKGLRLDGDVKPCGTVIGDRHRLRQSIANLLANAVKFTPGGGDIAVRCHREGDEVVVVVRDSGEGIAPDFLPRIFERFSQGDGAQLRTASGLGLGLSIVRQIMELHGGSVRAESEGPGRGATFTLRIPVAPDGAADGAQCDPSAPATRMLDGLKILVVDDDSETRESLALLLNLRGGSVRAAESVAEALDLCSREPPEIVITDISMPEQDGYALVGALRAASEPRPIVVALTGFAGPNERHRAAAAGFDAHVSKPVDLDILIKTIVDLAQPARV